MLNSDKCGIIIDGNNYNVYCYADDIPLGSTTPSERQKLIDLAVNFITRHVLRFIPTKTSFMLMGTNPLKSH